MSNLTLIISELACKTVTHNDGSDDHVYVVVEWREKDGAEDDWKAGCRWPVEDTIKIAQNDRASIHYPIALRNFEQIAALRITLYNRHVGGLPEKLGEQSISVGSITGPTRLRYGGFDSDYSLYYQVGGPTINAARLYALHCTQPTDDNADVTAIIAEVFEVGAKIAKSVGDALKAMPDPRAEAGAAVLGAVADVFGVVPEFTHTIAGATDDPDEIFVTYGQSEDVDKLRLYPVAQTTKKMQKNETAPLEGDDIQIPFYDGSLQIALHEMDPTKSNQIGIATLYEVPRSTDPSVPWQSAVPWGVELFSGGEHGGVGSALYFVIYSVVAMTVDVGIGPV